MRLYIKPVLEFIDVRTEEKFALTSICTVTGSCTDDDIQMMQAANMNVLQ